MKFFIFYFLLFSAKVFGAGVPTVSGTLPRSGGSSFTITVTVPSLNEAESTAAAGEDLLKDRLQIFVTESSGSASIPTVCSTNNFKVEYISGNAPTRSGAGSATVSSYILTYNLRIKECPPFQLSTFLQTNPTPHVQVNFLPAKGATAVQGLSSPIPKLDAVPAEAPAIQGVTGLDSALQFQYSASTSPKFSDSSNNPQDTFWAVVIDRKNIPTSSFNLPTKLFVRNPGVDSSVTDSSQTCQYFMNAVDGDYCVRCATANTYIDVQALSTSPISGVKVLPTTTNGSSQSVTGLTVGNQYAILATYDSGLALSTCKFGIPIRTKSMMELSGEGDAQDVGSKCFIATAAYGTPNHPNIEIFRWFRSTILLKTTVGKQFVRWYYKNGPVAAEYISQHEFLKKSVAAVLWIPAIFLIVLKAFVSNLQNVLCTIWITGFILYRARKFLLKKSAS